MLENAMVLDVLWRDMEWTPVVVGNCSECGAEICRGDMVYKGKHIAVCGEECLLLHAKAKFDYKEA